jgi:hypothetical protein
LYLLAGKGVLESTTSITGHSTQKLSKRRIFNFGLLRQQ